MNETLPVVRSGDYDMNCLFDCGKETGIVKDLRDSLFRTN